jgi:ParB-like nuclease family protein
VHFDPVAPEPSRPIQSPEVVEAIIRRDARDERADRDERRRDDEEDAEAPARGGLPPAFRMRHARHYVEHVMGDAPIRTVREIAVSDLEALPDADAADLQELEASIRSLGVLEPLLVTEQGGSYRVIGGFKRLRAARTAGLRTVPCLVQDGDAQTIERMREAVSVRLLPPAPPKAEEPAAPPADTSSSIDFVSALGPAFTAAGGDPFRRSVLSDLAAAELSRARAVNGAAHVMSEATPVLDRRPVQLGELVKMSEAAVAAEARLRGVRFDVSVSEPEYSLPADATMLAVAVSALLHGALALSAAPGSTIRIRAQGTVIRPALILDVVLDGVEIDAATSFRFFDGELRPHPAGASGSLLAGCVQRVARLHGGRASLQQTPAGCILTFVVPKPLND